LGSAVYGAHTYAEEGTYTAHVTLTGTTTLVVPVEADVADAPLRPVDDGPQPPPPGPLGITVTPGGPLQAEQQAPLTGAALATFVADDPLKEAGDFSAFVNWGD